MQSLKDRIRAEGQNLGSGILKVDAFINHQLDPQLTREMGEQFAEHFREHGATRILTAEVSGIAPAYATGVVMNLPVVYARKKKPVTMNGTTYQASAVSRTKGDVVTLSVSSDYIAAGDRVLIIDDFLARGITIKALVDIVSQAGAELVGIGTIIEKSFEGGRALLEGLNIPIHSLAIIDSLDEGNIQIR
ncbi:xanthine phosphoribosyltransferase [Deinococcus roseus]|uniref:Xanthine phosphoribosyltransferase n=1 Tax=Deinococcus roseus TaxID=392414 RepID=A0ABQ2DFR0_9DEIO|nr:xanthine phosphoribosyltransferase [Deinococcus roseus]GGJ54055.1 xanthine phosphoribosyltransferase [Deinococcus roseus]